MATTRPKSMGRATDATLTMAQPVDLTPYGSAELTFDWYIESGFDSGEYLALDFSPDGSSWTEIKRLRGNVEQENTWHNETIDLDPAYLTDGFKMRFRAYVSGSREDANVDNVKLVATSLSNQAPVADGQSVATDEDVQIGITLTGSDADGDLLTYAIATQPAHGTLSGSGANQTYTPDPDYFGSDSFTFVANDSTVNSTPATVSITVAPDR